MNVRLKSSAVPSTLRQERVEAISAIEGQILTDEQRRRLQDFEMSGLNPDPQRAEILRHYQSGFVL